MLPALEFDICHHKRISKGLQWQLSEAVGLPSWITAVVNHNPSPEEPVDRLNSSKGIEGLFSHCRCGILAKFRDLCAFVCYVLNSRCNLVLDVEIAVSGRLGIIFVCFRHFFPV